MNHFFAHLHRAAKFFAAAALLCLTPALHAQSPDLSGYWTVHLIYADGSAHDQYILLDQRSQFITGLQVTRNTGHPITGKFEDGKLSLVGTDPGNATRKTLYDGTFENGKLMLHVTLPNNPVYTAVADRTDRAGTLPPPRLPLPAPRDLPDNGLVRTPPMGWNSWNKFAGKVTDKDVRDMADAMVASGMSKLGYIYINIDDTWELGRDANGNITSNNKFPDMKALADYVHSKGLKIGIYSSPGPLTCAGYMASYGHEMQDAKTFASWGIDYIKYDLCSASTIYTSSLSDVQGYYQKFGEALQAQSRPIVYSLCEYGVDDPWKWGAKVGGNLWRTTGDISDHWASMDKIGFSQLAIAQYTRPGHWNDPDMLEIGNGGMTADEYRTHMSLWSMLSAPLLAGNDLRTMTDETKSILMNADVIAVDQDPAAHPTQILKEDGKLEYLTREMADGSIVIGLFNRNETATPMAFKWADLKLKGKLHARDLWAHADVPTTGDGFTAVVPRHGVVILRVYGKK